MFRLVIGILMTAGASGPVVAAAVIPATDITVRIYDRGLIGAADWTVIQDGASTILGEAGVRLEWRWCGAPVTCNQAFAADELAIRVIDAATPREFLGRLPLGYSLIDPQRHGGTLATVYLDRVHWLAHSARTDPRRLMARAIAHEIGHLLRGANVHAPDGLMRAIWDREELRHERREDWTISERDARAMREAVGKRRQETGSPVARR